MASGNGNVKIGWKAPASFKQWLGPIVHESGKDLTSFLKSAIDFAEPILRTRSEEEIDNLKRVFMMRFDGKADDSTISVNFTADEDMRLSDITFNIPSLNNAWLFKISLMMAASFLGTTKGSFACFRYSRNAA